MAVSATLIGSIRRFYVGDNSNILGHNISIFTRFFEKSKDPKRRWTDAVIVKNQSEQTINNYWTALFFALLIKIVLF
jgi:hypothetical protein